MDSTIDKKEKVITFGKTFSYLFKDIDIDEKFGNEIILDNKVVGGIHVRKRSAPTFTYIEMVGIEIDKEYRGLGIGTKIVLGLMGEADVIQGGITEKTAIPFWKRFNSIFYQVPRHLTPFYVKKTEISLAFFITKSKSLERQYRQHFENIGLKIYIT